MCFTRQLNEDRVVFLSFSTQNKMQLIGLNMRSKHFTTATLKFFYFSHAFFE